MKPHTFEGYGRARVIRVLRSQRCNAAEIAAFLAVSECEVRRVCANPPTGRKLETARRAAAIRWGNR